MRRIKELSTWRLISAADTALHVKDWRKAGVAIASDNGWMWMDVDVFGARAKLPSFRRCVRPSFLCRIYRFALSVLESV